MDGRSYIRIQLTDATELSVEELLDWYSCMLTWIHLSEKDPLDYFYQKINSKITNKGKEVLVYKPFFNVDYVGLPPR